jgi:hypothetical protein
MARDFSEDAALAVIHILVDFRFPPAVQLRIFRRPCGF